jgi:hypothetical protein
MHRTAFPRTPLKTCWHQPLSQLLKYFHDILQSSRKGCTNEFFQESPRERNRVSKDPVAEEATETALNVQLSFLLTPWSTTTGLLIPIVAGTPSDKTTTSTSHIDARLPRAWVEKLPAVIVRSFQVPRVKSTSQYSPCNNTTCNNKTRVVQLRLAVSKGLNQIGVSFSSYENESKSSFRNIVFPFLFNPGR